MEIPGQAGDGDDDYGGHVLGVDGDGSGGDGVADDDAGSVGQVGGGRRSRSRRGHWGTRKPQAVGESSAAGLRQVSWAGWRHPLHCPCLCHGSRCCNSGPRWGTGWWM